MLRKSKQAAKISALKASLQNADMVAGIILQNIEDGIALIDAAQTVVTFNPGAAQMIGATAEQAIGKPWSAILQFTDRHGISVRDSDNPISQALATQQSIRDDDAYIMVAGQRRLPLHLIVTPLINPKREIAATIIVMRDMSLEKEQEAAKTDFVSTASHEMRTPLAALEGYLELILSDKHLGQETMQHARKAHYSVMHLGQLFKNLLTTSQSEDGRLNHQPEVFVFNDLLKQVVTENHRQAEMKGINLQLAIGQPAGNGVEPLFHLNADPQKIQELLNNILGNAIKYTDSAGRINISAQAVDGFVQIKVEDSGYGVSPADLPHIFQKFYRVDNNQPGTGLGLFICKKIVELYAGDIWAESEVGRGSIFYVNLPRHEPTGD